MESCSYREVDVQTVGLEQIPQFQYAEESINWMMKIVPSQMRMKNLFHEVLKTITQTIKNNAYKTKSSIH